MIPRPFANQLDKKTWPHLARLGLRLAFALLKGKKTTRNTTQQSNGEGERVEWWENGQLFKVNVNYLI